MVFSQNKSTKAVADVWANGKKLHVQYSDGSSKDMDIPNRGYTITRIEDVQNVFRHVGQSSYIYLKGSDYNGNWNNRGAYKVYLEW